MSFGFDWCRKTLEVQRVQFLPELIMIGVQENYPLEDCYDIRCSFEDGQSPAAVFGSVRDPKIRARFRVIPLEQHSSIGHRKQSENLRIFASQSDVSHEMSSILGAVRTP